MINWQRPSATMSCAPGEVHLWRANLDVLPNELAALSVLLSSYEERQASRLIKPELGDRKRASFAILRDILSRYLACAPTAITFINGPHGKPYIKEPVLAAPLYFNVTHSNNWALYAITQANEVGIDIERIKYDIDIDGIAARFFSQAEHQQIQSLPEAQRYHGFFDCWTRKEAYIKAIGLGLSYPLKNFDVAIDASGASGLLRIENKVQEVAQWSLSSFEPVPEYRAAIAIRTPLCTLCYWQWDFLQQSSDSP